MKEKSSYLQLAQSEIKKLEDSTKGCKLYKGCKIIIRKNDLCNEYVEAIVNPANEQLEHAGGAAFAIR